MLQSGLQVMKIVKLFRRQKRLDLGALLVEEMKALGLSDVKMDEYGYVYGYLPATKGMEAVPALGLIAHLDTAPDYNGRDVKP